MFQGKYSTLKHCFVLDIEWVGEDFSTKETQFYKRLFKNNIEGQSGLTYPIFPVTIGKTKETGKAE